MKIAIVHDWISSFSGAERVLKQLHLMYPEAPIYTLFNNRSLSEKVMPSAQIIEFGPKGLQRFINRRYLKAMFPSAVESLDLSDYEILITSSPIFAKGIITRPLTKHICYCYSPARQLWDDDRKKSLGTHLGRMWDRSASLRPDIFIAISGHIQKRIKKYYRRDSIVIYPPYEELDAEYRPDGRDMNLARWENSYYLIVSRLIQSKNLELAAQAFNKMKKKLVVIGEGPLYNRLKRISGPNISILGPKTDRELAKFYKEAKAFVMPQEEDFGLTTIEAMAYGKPVIALNRGSAPELIQDGVTGILFDDPIVESIGYAVNKFEEQYYSFNPKAIAERTKKYSASRFREELDKVIKS